MVGDNNLGSTCTAFFAPAVFGGKVLAPVDCVECLFKPFATQPMEEVHNQYNVDGASQLVNLIAGRCSSPGKVMGIWDGTLILTMGLHCRKSPLLSPGDWHHWLFGFLPFWTAWDAGILLQFFIAGLGMIILLKSRGIPGPNSVRIAWSCEFQFLLPSLLCGYMTGGSVE